MIHFNMNIGSNNTFSNVMCCLIVAFNMYDLDGDSMISREELLSVLHMMVGANISEEQVSWGALWLFVSYCRVY